MGLSVGRMCHSCQGAFEICVGAVKGEKGIRHGLALQKDGMITIARQIAKALVLLAWGGFVHNKTFPPPAPR